MRLAEARILLRNDLNTVYDEREAALIADWVIEKLTGLRKVDQLVHRDHQISAEENQTLKKWTAELMSHRPVQYVLAEADFFGLKFFVDENVLIPRPETEELVDWILKDVNRARYSIIDIGTGSGCIPVALKSRNNLLEISACDISDGALRIATSNAAKNKTNIHFFSLDILDENAWPALPSFNIIVSNPPYIPESGQQSMKQNVLRYEPHLALFTPDDDPFIFYEKIASFGISHLSANGRIYFEIFEEGAEGVEQILKGLGYSNVQLKMDMYDRPRMISAQL